jgi:alkylation response protein AidB-like acyl-CoA dehydrogenase
MTFELSSEEQALQTRARAVAAEHIAPIAATVDANAAIPDVSAVRDLVRGTRTPIEMVVVIEELAATSAAVAAAVALDVVGLSGAATDADPQRVGLRGLGAVDAPLSSLPGPGTARAQLALAAVALGIGRAAVDEALAMMRAAGDRPGGNADERPHWMLSDTATELEGARLLTLKAAQADGDADARLAKVFAAEVAERAVAAAARILGPDGYRRGAVIERLARDARAITMLGGTPDTDRALVADATLPS